MKHLIEHRQGLSRQLDEVEQDRDLFHQKLTQQKTNPQRNLLIQQVNQWEQESIEKIRQTAQELRQLLSIDTNEKAIKTQLDQLTQQMRESRENAEIIEGDLHKWKAQLKQLTQQLNTPSNIAIEQTDTPVVKKIQVQFSSKCSHF